MSVRGLQTLLATTLTDRQRKDALLRGCPTAYEGFELSAREVIVLMRIQAATLEEFAQQAHWLFYGEDLTLECDQPLQRRTPAVRKRVSA
jgi:hypothetical protein